MEADNSYSLSRQGNAAATDVSSGGLEYNSGMRPEQAAEASYWDLARGPAKRWTDPAHLARIERQQPMLEADKGQSDEFYPSPKKCVIGQMQPLERKQKPLGPMVPALISLKQVDCNVAGAFQLGQAT